MSDLVVIAFPTEAKAEEVRQKLLAMQKNRTGRRGCRTRPAPRGTTCGNQEDSRDPGLADAGSCREATVRAWKKRPELQAHCRIVIQNARGLPVAAERRWVDIEQTSCRPPSYWLPSSINWRCNALQPLPAHDV
jgi:hypothetical protein